jgi:hypothetical protein
VRQGRKRPAGKSLISIFDRVAYQLIISHMLYRYISYIIPYQNEYEPS